MICVSLTYAHHNQYIAYDIELLLSVLLVLLI